MRRIERAGPVTAGWSVRWPTTAARPMASVLHRLPAGTAPPGAAPAAGFWSVAASEDVRRMAGGNSAESVPGVVELAPVFGNGGAPASRRRLRARTRRRGSTSPGLFPLHPDRRFRYTFWEGAG